MSITHTPPPATTAVSLPSDQLAHVRALKATVRAAEAQILVAACEWADSHPALPDHPEPYAAERSAAVRRQDAGWLAQQDPFDLDDPDASIPELEWDADAPFAAALGLSTAAGGRLLREALVLRHRLPKLWRRVLAGEVEAWRARRIAARAMGEPADVVAYLDDRATPQADTLGLARLDRLVDEAMLRLHFEEREFDQPPSTTGTPLSTRCAGDITGSRPTPAGATSPSNPAPGSGPNPTACASSPTTAALGT